MHDNVDAEKQSDAAPQEDFQALPELFDDVEISDLMPGTEKNVSRATSQTSTQMDAARASEEAAPASDDEFELEISDLPPSQRSHYLLLGLHKWRATLARC